MKIGVGMALLLLVLLPSVGEASADQGAPSRGLSFSKLQIHFGSLAVHAENFSPLTSPAQLSCEETRPPEALATTEPLISSPQLEGSVTFIIGTDGRVHSPLIMESLGSSLADRILLDAVRAWRYRHATCDGIPTEVEGKIAFRVASESLVK